MLFAAEASTTGVMTVNNFCSWSWLLFAAYTLASILLHAMLLWAPRRGGDAAGDMQKGWGCLYASPPGEFVVVVDAPLELGSVASRSFTCVEVREEPGAWVDVTALEVTGLVRALTGTYGTEVADRDLLECLGVCADDTEHWRQVCVCVCLCLCVCM